MQPLLAPTVALLPYTLREKARALRSCTIQQERYASVVLIIIL